MSALRLHFPLDTQLPATVSGTVLGTALALGLTTGVAATVSYLYGRRLRGSADRTRALSRSRRALRWGLPLTYVTALVAMVLGGWLQFLDLIADDIPAGTTAVGDAVSVVVALAVPTVAPIGAYLGLFPAITALRDIEMSVTTVVGRLVRYVLGLVALVTVLVAATIAILGGSSSGLATLVAFAVVVGVLLVGSPWIIRLLQDTRAPTERERERLDRLCDQAGLAPRSVRILESGGAKQAYAALRGVPGRRHLFVTDYLLDELDDDRLGTYLAIQAGRARLLHLEARTLIVVGTIGLAGSLALNAVSLPGISDGAAGFAVLVFGGLALWVGQWLVYRADDYAVERTSRDAVEETIRTSAELNDAPMAWGRLAALRQMEPSLVARIDRLRDRAARE